VPANAALDALLARLPGSVRRAESLAARDRDDERDRLPTGMPDLDHLLAGGLPRGQLSELVRHGSAGATTLVHRLAAAVTARGELVAWVDPTDAFDPESAASLGVVLSQLLWVRAPGLEAALRAGELLLGVGGFALVLIDLAHLPARSRMGSDERSHWTSHATERPGVGASAGHRRAVGADVPAQGRVERRAAEPRIWLRLTRAASAARAALVVLRDTEGGAGSFAALRLEVVSQRVLWDEPARGPHAPREPGAPGAPSAPRTPRTPRLFDGLVSQISLTRRRGDAGAGEITLRIA
jgi:hypothetical protein